MENETHSRQLHQVSDLKKIHGNRFDEEARLIGIGPVVECPSSYLKRIS